MFAAETERLYVLTASQTIEVKEIASGMKQVDSVIQKSGGYVQSQSVREEEQAYLVLRVPAPQLRPMLDAMAALGSEESRSVASQDVTEQYIDTEARLKNAIALRDRLKALLGQAKGVKDILEIEKELTRVQSDIDSMEGRLKKLKGQVDFAQIDLTLKRKKILGPLGYIVYGIGWVIQKLFVIN
jgi:DNA-binding FrmR family transcriptional regulator